MGRLFPVLPGISPGRVAMWAAVLLMVLLPAGIPAADVNDLVFQGADAHYKGNLDLAAARFEAALRMAPDNTFARNQLALVYAKQNRVDRAKREFSTVVRRDPGNTFARLWLGILALKQGELDRAFRRHLGR